MQLQTSFVGCGWSTRLLAREFQPDPSIASEIQAAFSIASSALPYVPFRSSHRQAVQEFSHRPLSPEEHYSEQSCEKLHRRTIFLMKPRAPAFAQKFLSAAGNEGNMFERIHQRKLVLTIGNEESTRAKIQVDVIRGHGRQPPPGWGRHPEIFVWAVRTDPSRKGDPSTQNTGRNSPDSWSARS